MKQGCVAILDVDEEYVRKLGHYLNESDFMALRVFVFSNQQKFDSFLDKEKMDVILVQKNLWKEEYKSQNGIALCENLKEVPEDICWIYKYQSARIIGQEIMGVFAKNMSGKVFYRKKEAVAVFSVFPVGDENLGMIFAWELAKVVGKKKRTLFISLKSFSGMSTGLGENWREDLSDCIFFLRKGKGNLAVKIQAVIRQEEVFYYIPPTWSEEDLGSVSKEEWRKFLQVIMEDMDFEQIVLDLSEGVGDFRFWLLESNYVFTPLADAFSDIRVQERRRWMENRMEGAEVKKWITFSGDGLKKTRVFGIEEELQNTHYVNQILKGNGVWDGEIQENNFR